MNKSRNNTEQKQSIRGKIIVLNPGESICLSREEAKVSYIRYLSSMLKTDFGSVFSVHVDQDGTTVTRIK